MMQQTKMPGYTGFKPTQEEIFHQSPTKEGGARVPGICKCISHVYAGYSGYVPGIKSENVFGESYGKTSTQANNGQIQRGFDLEASEKYKSISQSTYQNQRELYKKMMADKLSEAQHLTSVHQEVR